MPWPFVVKVVNKEFSYKKLYEEQVRGESSALKHVEIESEDDPINLFDTEENKKLIIKIFRSQTEVFAGIDWYRKWPLF